MIVVGLRLVKAFFVRHLSTHGMGVSRKAVAQKTKGKKGVVRLLKDCWGP